MADRNDKLTPLQAFKDWYSRNSDYFDEVVKHMNRDGHPNMFDDEEKDAERNKEYYEKRNSWYDQFVEEDEEEEEEDHYTKEANACYEADARTI